MAAGITYESGPVFNIVRTITKGEFVQIIDELDKEFGEGWLFEPEPITEGGIVIGEWPGKEKKHYKSMRLHTSWKWPWVGRKWREKWKDNSEEAIKKGICRTFLKAFHGADPWMVEEIDKIAAILANHDIIVV